MFAKTFSRIGTLLIAVVLVAQAGSAFGQLSICETFSNSIDDSSADSNGAGASTATYDQLKSTLENMGYEIKEIEWDGGRSLQIRTAIYTIELEIASDQKTLWMVAYMGPIPEEMSRERLIELMKVTHIGRARFGVRFSENWLSLQMPCNLAEITPELARGLREQIEILTGFANSTRELWDPDHWQ